MKKNAKPLPNDPFYGTEEVAAYIKYSVNHLRYLIRQGKFPAPVRVNGRKQMWRQSTLDAWANEIEKRHGVKAAV